LDAKGKVRAWNVLGETALAKGVSSKAEVSKLKKKISPGENELG